MIAVIKTGGKQYRVTENDVIYVEKLNGNENDTVVFNDVLMCDEKIGTPLLANAKVEGVIEKNGKQKKIRIFKYVSNHRSNRRTLGHRQPYTKVRITKIIG